MDQIEKDTKRRSPCLLSAQDRFGEIIPKFLSLAQSLSHASNQLGCLCGK